MNLLRVKTSKTVVLVLALGAAFAAGRFLAPDKVITQTEVVEVEKEVIREVVKESETESVQLERQTHTIITERPDGTKITEIFEVNKDTIVIDRRSEQGFEVDTETESEISDIRIVERSRPQWKVGTMAVTSSFEEFSVDYGLTVERRMFGPIFMGVTGVQNQGVGLTLSIEF